MVVVSVIALLLAIGLPAMRLAREHGRETVCRSHLRQMALILKTYTNEHDNLFPAASYIYHSPESFTPEMRRYYPLEHRWHDPRIGLDSDMLRDRPELRGTLWSYLDDKEIQLCNTGRKANEMRGCHNRPHPPGFPMVAQYTYTMNAYLGSTITTGGTGNASGEIGLDTRTLREMPVKRSSQVTRSPSDVFVFGEQNSWAINTEGRQPITAPLWPAAYDLSGISRIVNGHPGTLHLGDLEIASTYRIKGDTLRHDADYIGHAFATCHRPHKGDLNTGHSYAAMLDGHVEKITVADQLRKSRRISGLGDSHLGPGGNLALAWPLDTPPPGGWENQ